MKIKKEIKTQNTPNLKKEYLLIEKELILSLMKSIHALKIQLVQKEMNNNPW